MISVTFDKVLGETTKSYHVLFNDKPIFIPKSRANVVDIDACKFQVEEWLLKKHEEEKEADRVIHLAHIVEINDEYIVAITDDEKFNTVSFRRSCTDIIDLEKKIIKIPSWYTVQKKTKDDYRATVFQHTFSHGFVMNHPAVDGKWYQNEAYEKLCKLACFMLFMECRSGKSKVMIDIACNHFANGTVSSVLWLCPLSVIETAKEEWQKYGWGDVDVDFLGLETLSGMSEDNFNKEVNRIKDRAMLVVSESHLIKNHQAIRSQRLSSIREKFSVVGIETGTPITRNLEDIYNQVALLDWRILGYKKISQFRSNHIKYSRKIPGLIRDTRNEEYITQRIEPFVYEYFTPKYENIKFEVVDVEMTDAQRHYYDLLKARTVEKIKAHEDSMYDIYLLFTGLLSVTTGFLSKKLLQSFNVFVDDDVDIETNKYDEVKRIIDSHVGSKIVWCTRKHQLKKLVDIVKTSYVVSGDMSHEERHKVISDFKLDNNAVLVAMTQVARRGIDIKTADTAIFVGQSFDYEMREQSIARMYGIDKEQGKKVVDVVCSCSIDDTAVKSGNKKERLISYFKELIKKNRDAAVEELSGL